MALGCGNLTYRVLEAASLIQVDTLSFSINLQQSLPYVDFFPKSKAPWISLSPFAVVLEARLGNYATVYSVPLKINIVDPCLLTTINPQHISQITASKSDKTLIQRFLAFFTDTVSSSLSQQFGNGNNHDMCGPQTYSLFTTSNSKPSWIYLKLDVSGSYIIILDPNLLPTSVNGLYEFKLQVTLSNY